MSAEVLKLLQERAKQLKKDRRMSDDDFEPKDELKRSLEEFQFSKLLQSQSSSEDVFSPLSSPRKLSNDTEARSVEPQPTTSWTVVEVGSPRQELPKQEPPKQEASKIVIERAKPQLPTKPKPAPPPKPKSPSKELNAPKYTVTTPATNTKSGSNVLVSDYQEIGIDAKTSKEELPKLELKSDAAESKTKPSTSPNGGVRGMMSLFEGRNQQTPLYSKPDMSQRKPKSFFTRKDKAPSVTEKTRDVEDIVEVSPAIPDRQYTEEDVSSLSPTPKPSPPPSPVRKSSPQMSPKQNRFDSLKTSTSPGDSAQNDDENPYEVVAPRQKETSSVPPPPLLHQRRFESRQDVPPATPRPFKDRRPAPPTRAVSLASSSPSLPSTLTIDSDYAEVSESVRRPLVSMASSSPSFPSTVTIDSDYAGVSESVRRPLVSMASSSPSFPSIVTIDSDYAEVSESVGRPLVCMASSSPSLLSIVIIDSDYAEVSESVRRPLVSNESPYSEVEDTTPIQEVEAYYTTDILRSLPTKTGGDSKRVPPPKPLPFQRKSTMEDDSKPKTLSDPKPVRTPPAKPAPYRPKKASRGSSK